MAGEHGEATYTVRYDVQGADQASQKLREFAAAKKDADQAAARDIQAHVTYGGGVTPGGIHIPPGVPFSRPQPAEAGGRSAGLSAADQRLMQEVLGEAASRRKTISQDEQIRQQKEKLAQQDRQIAAKEAAFSDRQQQTQQRELDRDVQHKLNLRNQEERDSVSRRVASAFGWAPIPGGQNIYMTQMALEALGLGGGAVLGGTLAAAGLGLGVGGYLLSSNTSAAVASAAQHFSAMAGGTGAAPRPIDQAMAAQMTNIGAAFNLTRTQTMQAMGNGLAGLNLANPTRMVQATQLGLAEAQNAGVAPDQGIQLAGTLMARLGLTADQTSTALQRINQAADAAHTSVTQFSQDLNSLGGYLQPGTNFGQLGMLEGVAGQYGMNLTQLMGGSLTSTGMQRIQQAALLGISPDQMMAMQQQNPAQLFRLQQQAFQRYEANAPAGSQRSVAEAVFGQAGLLPSDVSADTFARAMESTLSDQQIAAFQKQLAGQGPPQAPGAFVSQAETANVTAATANIRIGILAQQAATAATNDLTNPGFLAGAGATVAAGAVAGSFIAPGPGTVIGGALGGLGFVLAQIAGQIHGQQQQASASGSAGQLVGNGAQRVDLYFYDGNTGQQTGRVTLPQGQSTATARLTPGQGLPSNVQRVGVGTPSQSSLTGR